MNPRLVNIEDLAKPDVLLALCRTASPRRRRQSGFPWLLPARRWLTCTDMHRTIDSRRRYGSVNLKFEEETWEVDGVMVKIALYVDLSYDMFDPTIFDHRHGKGAAEKAIYELRQSLQHAESLMRFRWESKV